MTAGVRGGGVLPLLVIATTQLMLVLDDSIVNIALPSIQRELGVSPVDLPWVVNAYILAFGALLLLGGRIGDLWGRRRTLQVGLAVFVLASLVGGLAQEPVMLVVSRAVQGIGAAMAAPNALALIATTFPERKMRDMALSLYGAMSGIGIIVGLLLGGLLTGTLGWRWVFFLNVPIGLLALLGTRTLVAAERHQGRFGALGAVLGTGGMVALVSAITRAGEAGFGDILVIALFIAAVALILAFVSVQRGSRSPLLPLSLFRDSNRSGAYVTMLLLAIGPMGTFYVLTLYLQRVRDFEPMQAGAAWLPFAAGIIIGAGAAPKLLLRATRRAVAVSGALLSSLAVFWLSAMSVDTSYWLHLAPAMFLLALGFGLGVIALTQSAVYNVDQDQAGIASALLNTAQQLGVALGLAVLAGVAAAATRQNVPATAAASEALVNGYQVALLVAGGVLFASAVSALVTLRNGSEQAEDIRSDRAANAEHTAHTSRTMAT